MKKVLQCNHSDNKPEFIMLVGLPGSGKSTLIKRYKEYKVHSSDDIREELTGDVNRQDINNLVFKALHKRVKEDLLKTVALTAVNDIFLLFSEHITDEDYTDIVKALLCLSKSCFIDMPHF